jgi:hypothetical protein
MAISRETGRLRWFIGRAVSTGRNGTDEGCRYWRDSEVRWQGTSVQWVLSGVQVALWTGMQRHQPCNWRLNWCPLARVY